MRSEISRPGKLQVTQELKPSLQPIEEEKHSQKSAAEEEDPEFREQSRITQAKKEAIAKKSAELDREL